jgi:hypothetical protein
LAGNVTDTIAVVPRDIDDWHHPQRGSPWAVIELLRDGNRVVLDTFETEAEAYTYAETFVEPHDGTPDDPAKATF